MVGGKSRVPLTIDRHPLNHIGNHPLAVRQGHVKITACAELVTISDELWNTAALVFPTQSTLSLKCSL